MTRTDLEHFTEIRRSNRTTPIWVALVALAAILAFVLGAGDETGEDAGGEAPTTVPAPPTSETLTTTSPRGLPAVHGLTAAGGDGALVAFSTAVAPSADGGDPVVGTVQAVLVSDDVVVVLAGGTVHAAEAGRSFRPVVACCVEGLIPSNEPGHVWLRDDGEVALLELRGGGYVTELDVGDGEVLGPASFGIVVLGSDGLVRWHRPSFDPTVVQLPGDRRAIDSGGERLLVVAPGDGAASRLETWSIAGNGLLQTYVLADGAAASGVLAPDGSVLAIPSPGGWEVRDAASGLVRGTLAGVVAPVWVGGARFAASLGERLVVSDSGELPLAWPVLAVAEQSP